MLSRIFKPRDVFISYAVEDRDLIDELNRKLSNKDLRIWYAYEQLYPGVNIRALIHEGLSVTRYGIVVISPRSNTPWVNGELFMLMMRKKKFIPILHEVTIYEAAVNYPGITDIYCLESSKGVDYLAEYISNYIRRRSFLYYMTADACFWFKKNISRLMYMLIFLMLLVSAGIYAYIYNIKRPSDTVVETGIRQRIISMQKLAEKEFIKDLSQNKGSVLYSTNSLHRLLPAQFPASRQKQRIHFYNGVQSISALPGLKYAGIISDTTYPDPPFGLSNYHLYKFSADNSRNRDFKYALYSTSPVRFILTGSRLLNDSIYEADILFSNVLLYAQVNLSETAGGQTECITNMWGLKPKETLVFMKTGGEWTYTAAR